VMPAVKERMKRITIFEACGQLRGSLRLSDGCGDKTIPFLVRGSR